MNRWLAYFLFMFFLIAIEQPLASQLPGNHYNFKHLNVQNGLAQNIVYHFLQDSRGYMWIGTRNGLTFYDGSQTTNFLHDETNNSSLGGNFITRLAENSSGEIWIGHNAGLSLYNRTANSFFNYGIERAGGKIEKDFIVPLGFAGPYDLWLIDIRERSIKVFNTKTKKTKVITATTAVDGTLFSDSLTNTVHIWTYLSTGTIHYTCKNYSLIKAESYFTINKASSRNPARQVTHVLIQDSSTVWISADDGLIELNPLTGKYNIYNRWKNQTISGVRFTAQAHGSPLLWVATGNNAVYIFDRKSKKFTDNYKNHQLDPSSICSDNIVSLYIDRMQTVWCGSYGSGVSYTNTGGNFFSKHLSKNELARWKNNNSVSWLCFDNNKALWCLFTDMPGICKLDSNKQIINYRLPVSENGKAFTGSFYKILFEKNNEAWCTSRDGLFLYNVATNRLRKMNYFSFSENVFGSRWINDIIRLNDASVLFCSDAGIYRIKTKKTGYSIEPFSDLNKKEDKDFEALHQDESGTIYVKAGGEIIYILKNNNREKEYRVTDSVFFPADIHQFYDEPHMDTMFLATNLGLFFIDKKKFIAGKSNIQGKVPFLSISCLQKDKNRFWLFGEKGIFYFDENTHESRKLSIDDGLPSNEFNVSAIAFSANGECIAGSTNGLVSFYPKTIEDTLYAPSVQITNIRINDSTSGFVPNARETGQLNLSHRQNTFSFEFAPITFQHAAECTYEYRLSGYDEGWINGGTIQNTRYSKIPSGEYIFQLRIRDARGKLSPHEKNLQVNIGKAFWQTIPFKAGVLALILFAGWLILKWYLNIKIRKQKREFEKKQAIEKERTRIATDMHDDLGAGLSRIKFLSETIGIKKQQQQPIEEDIIKIRQYSHEMIDKMGEIVWALNEKNDSLNDLLSYTRSYSVEYLSQNGIGYTVDFPENIPVSLVSGEFRRNIFLSVKEILHNIVKHAQASHVSITMAANHHLNIKIRDDGIGFDVTNIRQYSNGLTNIEKRMKDIDGTMQIKNQKGTMIVLIAPLP
jgi:signal transduction histidine kinase/ligand-binding sensor domain-containing protein